MPLGIALLVLVDLGEEREHRGAHGRRRVRIVEHALGLAARLGIVLRQVVDARELEPRAVQARVAGEQVLQACRGRYAGDRPRWRARRCRTWLWMSSVVAGAPDAAPRSTTTATRRDGSPGWLFIGWLLRGRGLRDTTSSPSAAQPIMSQFRRAHARNCRTAAGLACCWRPARPAPFPRISSDTGRRRRMTWARFPSGCSCARAPAPRRPARRRLRGAAHQSLPHGTVARVPREDARPAGPPSSSRRSTATPTRRTTCWTSTTTASRTTGRSRASSSATAATARTSPSPSISPCAGSATRATRCASSWSRTRTCVCPTRCSPSAGATVR